MEKVIDIDLDVINATNRLQEGEAIVYIRVGKGNVFINTKGSDLDVSIGLSMLIERLDIDNLEIVRTLEDSLDEFYQRNPELELL